MADEQNRPVEQNTEQPQVLHEQGTGKEVPVTPDYVAADPQTITDKQPPQNAVEASASGALEASEQAVNTPPVEGFDKAIDKLEHAMERGAEHAAEPHPIHVPSDTVIV
jgi:hypothetical protein